MYKLIRLMIGHQIDKDNVYQVQRTEFSKIRSADNWLTKEYEIYKCV